MANNCYNSIIIKHNDLKKLEALRDSINQGKFFNHIIPVPEDLVNTVSGTITSKEHEDQIKRNLELYGYKDWYDFCTEEWGTKWEADSDYECELEGNTITFHFITPWSPPEGVYMEMEDQGYEIEATYEDEYDNFSGEWKT
jgi:hypothetical protein